MRTPAATSLGSGVEARRAIQRRKGDERFLAPSVALVREAGAAYGETVVVELAPDAEPDRIDLGELAAALAADDDARARFNAMAPGRPRSLAHYGTSAKRAETREARAEEVPRKLATHTRYGNLHPPRREE